MLHSRADYRIGVHRLPDRSVHGDLFVALPGREGLLTFEIEGMVMELLDPPVRRIVLVLADASLRPSLRGAFRVFDSTEALFTGNAASLMRIPLQRKSDHRQMYMTYSGKVETRGELQEFMRGKLDGFAFGVDNYLVVER